MLSLLFATIIVIVLLFLNYKHNSEMTEKINNQNRRTIQALESSKTLIENCGLPCSRDAPCDVCRKFWQDVKKDS